MTYATRDKAAKAIEAKGYALRPAAVMGAAPWVKAGGYAWISEVWSPKHGKYRFQAHMAGA